MIVLVALLVCLIPTTIGGLLSAIGIAGMDRLVRRNVLALSGRAVEAAGDCSTLLLDKTGTITLGNRQATEFIPLPGVTELELADAAQLASLADETPEGRSIVVLAKEQHGLREREVGAGMLVPVHRADAHERHRPRRPLIRKGAADSIRDWIESAAATVPAELGRDRRRHRRVGRHAARRRRGRPRARRRPPEGRRQGGPARALRGAAVDGDPHRDDHRRQPADGEGDRRRGRRRRLPRRGDARGQDGADPARAGGRQPRRDDRRRHERRARRSPRPTSAWR